MYCKLPTGSQGTYFPTPRVHLYAGLPRSKMKLLSIQSLSDVMYQPWKGKELETA
jgi:hypothetical protein